MDHGANVAILTVVAPRRGESSHIDRSEPREIQQGPPRRPDIGRDRPV